MEVCHAGAGEEHEEEGVEQMENYELTTSTFPAPHRVEGTAGVKNVKQLGRKSNLRGREGWGKTDLQ